MQFPKHMAVLKEEEKYIRGLGRRYFNHLWISDKSHDSYHYLGISDYAKKHFLRYNKINYEKYFKTNYSIVNNEFIKAFLIQIQQKRQLNTLRTSQNIEYNRFAIKKNQPFAILETYEFDIQLQAPVEMRVIKLPETVTYEQKINISNYLFMVEILRPEQIQTLMTEDEYNRSKKMFEF